MDITVRVEDGVAMVTLDGRFDAHGAMEFDAKLKSSEGFTAVCLDMENVDYLSSAGIRSLMAMAKRLGGPSRVALARPCDYVKEVLRVTGMERVLRVYGGAPQALAALSGAAEPAAAQTSGERACAAGRFVFRAGSPEPTWLEIIGHVSDVLQARVTAESLVMKKFSQKEHSIGLGALGASKDDCAPFLGEMMTVGGTMVWLPTDGNDTPDFLIPQSDSDLVGIRTAFNASLGGAFNEFCLFEAADPRGATVLEIYERLFERARETRGDKAGIVGLAMRAHMTEVYGSGVKISPIQDFAPKDGASIMAPQHIEKWLEADKEPRWRDVTALVVGFGARLDADLSGFRKEDLDAVFYLNPANKASKRFALHNHAVLFERQPHPAAGAELDDVVRKTVEEGQFVDMRHLLDSSRLSHAVIGVSYVSSIRREKAGE
ncbi:MAG TPA: STAS domain-containing protein [Candidatus Brocadiia bacterium]|nr:STAS domain-containing protein [Candidatus Brocadiia bacterium]